MCLQSSHTQEQRAAVIPSKPFYAYKYVTRRDGRLISPVRSYEWLVGENLANADSRDDMAGIYVMMIEPGRKLQKDGEGHVVLRVQVNPADVKNVGPDSFGGVSCTCLVATKVTISQEDYDNALANNSGVISEIDLPEVKRYVARGMKELDREKERAAVAAAKKTKTSNKNRKAASKLAAKVKKTAGKKPAKKAGSKFDLLSVTQLRAFAKNLGLKNYAKLTRAKLIAAIKKA